MRGIGAEVDARHPRRAQRVEDGPRVARHPGLVVLERKRADPGVEELNRLGAGGHLRLEVAGHRGSKLAQQLVKGLWLGEHERLDLVECARGTALDQVAGQREWRAGEADDGNGRLGDHLANRGDDLRRSLLPIRHSQPVDVARAVDWMCNHRTHVLDELEVDAHAVQRQHDVGEHHRRIDSEPAHRLQSHLGAELRLGHDFGQRPALAHLAVLGQRTTRLAHQPYRCRIHRTPVRGIDEPAQPAAACSVASITPSSCAAETNHASNCDGGRTTPPSSMW